jgi:hypothetical protein
VPDSFELGKSFAVLNTGTAPRMRSSGNGLGRSGTFWS